MTALAEADIRRNLDDVQERIAQACHRVGRDPKEVTLVAITKTRSIEEIAAAYACGLRDFGENRAEEAADKIPELGRRWADDRPAWHMVGHIQSRKAQTTAELFQIVHSVDSLRLAERLDRFAGEFGRRLPILLEVNVSGEATKYGFPAWDETSRARFLTDLAPLDAAGPLGAFPHLQVRGLMTMAPIVADPQQARPVFQALRALRDVLWERLPGLCWDELSMGMTDDYEVAVEEGATMVRIGRAIFGPSTY